MASPEFPIVVNIPTQVGNGLVRLTAGTEFRIYEVSGNLFALTTGPHTIRVRRAVDGSTVGQITWNAAGVQIFTETDQYVAHTDGLLFDCTALGTGAQYCTLTLWCRIPTTI